MAARPGMGAAPSGWPLWVADPPTAAGLLLRGLGRVYLDPRRTHPVRKVARAGALGLVTLLTGLLTLGLLLPTPATHPVAASSSRHQDGDAAAERAPAPTPETVESTPKATRAAAKLEPTAKNRAKARSTTRGAESPTVRSPRSSPANPRGVPQSAQAAIVAQHVDGDTLAMRALRPGAVLPSTSHVTVRLLEVDTPETKKPGAPVECFGPQATGFLAKIAPVGSKVWLLPDIERRDQYGRHLLYVWTNDGVFVNREIVRTGHGTAVLYAPNDAFIGIIRAAEAGARAARRGLWRACDRAAIEPAAKPKTKPKPKVTRTTKMSTRPSVPGGGYHCPASHPVKGNHSSSGDFIYHEPDGRYYDVTKPEECFVSASAAETAGYRAPLNE